MSACSADTTSSLESIKTPIGFEPVITFMSKVLTFTRALLRRVMGSIHYAARVVGQIRGALESKKNSFVLIITTQSDEPPAGVFRAELQYARGVRAGRIVESRVSGGDAEVGRFTSIQ